MNEPSQPPSPPTRASTDEHPTFAGVTPDVGYVTADPLLALKLGAEVHFAETRITFPFEERAGALVDWRVAQGLVLGFSVSDGRQTEVHGSAVLVAPGVALCAAHVVEQYIEALVGGRLDAVCFGLAHYGVDLWRVRHVTQAAAGTDISILGLEAISAPPADATYRRASMTTRLPKIGERLLCLGFRPATAAFDVDSSRQLAIHASLIASAGPVRQRFPTGRDRRVLPWPSVEVDMPAWGAMSGGPVFDEAGRLIGLLSRSLESEDEPSPSYVSLLWPAMTTRFRRGWPSLADIPESPSLLEMDRRMCAVDRREAIRQGGDGVIHYDAWE